MGTERLRECVQSFTRLVDTARGDENRIVTEGCRILSNLISADDWLPEFATIPDDMHYRQYLLHCDPAERFSVVSFVWGPGQVTPIHDHTVWGLVGMLRGEELSRRYEIDGDGSPPKVLGESRLRPGEIDIVSPTRGDVHMVSNALADRPSISIHVYGGNIGAVQRHAFDSRTGAPKTFISGYSAPVVPNLWDRSTQMCK